MAARLKLSALSALLALGAAKITPATAADCGTVAAVAVAVMTWLSAGTLASADLGKECP